MADWWDPVELEITQEDRLKAALVSAAMEETSHLRIDKRENTYWTRPEMNNYGALGEFAFARYIGRPDHVPLDPYGRSHPRPDLAPYEVRTGPWRRLEHWHLSKYGTVYTFAHERECSEHVILVRLDYFLKGNRMWLSGWIRGDEAQQFAVLPGRNIQRHAVPFEALHPPRALPLSAAQELRLTRARRILNAKTAKPE